ncbi:MAG: amidohydrolase family protein, partial [Acidobacteriota bacterium]
VYPGFFDPLTRLGLTEVGSVSATEDTEEIAEYNPELVAAAAVHPDSEHIPVARANGITHALSAPGSGGGGGFFGFGTSGGALAGQGSVIHLAGWTAEEMALDPSAVMVLQWPALQTRSFDFSTFSVEERPFTEAKEEYDEGVEELERWFRAAEHYARARQTGEPERLRRDVKLEALLPVVQGELPVLLVANEKRSIEDGLAFAERHGLEVILAGGAEAWKVKEMLAERQVPVVLRPTQSLPVEEDDPYDRPFTTAGELHAAGVTIAFATFSSADSRLLPYEAGHAVPYGLPREEALKAITRNPAEIFGLGERLGTVEPGKLGNLVLTGGDPLEIRTRVERVFIQGREVSTDNKHRRLYERYRSRPR